MVVVRGAARQFLSRMFRRIAVEAKPAHRTARRQLKADGAGNGVQVIPLAGAALFRLNGRMDNAICDELLTNVQQLVAVGERHVLIDLERVPWLGRTDLKAAL